jgi:hypothetical protein
MPDLTGFKEMGFKVHASHGDLYVEKKTSKYRLRFYQGLEPYHPQLSKLVDFEIPDGFFMIEFYKDRPSIVDGQKSLGPIFQSIYERGNFWFFFNPKLDFVTPSVAIKADKVIKFLEKN